MIVLPTTLVLAYLIMIQSTVRQYLAKRNILANKSSIIAKSKYDTFALQKKEGK